jgi:hypothetical protein
MQSGKNCVPGDFTASIGNGLFSAPVFGLSTLFLGSVCQEGAGAPHLHLRGRSLFNPAGMWGSGTNTGRFRSRPGQVHTTCCNYNCIDTPTPTR